MSAATLLDKLTKAKPTGPGRWIACCPAHEDKSPSLAVRELDDGRVLLHCFAGCCVEEVIGAIGLTFADLFTERIAHHCKPERQPFSAADALRCTAFDALVVSAAATIMREGKPLAPEDVDRLMIASGRISDALTAAGVRHG